MYVCTCEFPLSFFFGMVRGNILSEPHHHLVPLQLGLSVLTAAVVANSQTYPAHR